MIENTFLLLERIKKGMQQKFFQQGILTWNDFLKKTEVKGLSNQRKLFYNKKLVEAKQALYRHDSEYFFNRLPNSEAWRLYDFFRDEAVFLDIETSGWYTDVTVVGLFDGFKTMTMVKGINLDGKTLKRHLKKYKIIVTYNGLSFDAVVLNKYYPGVIPKIPHFDLRFHCDRIGLRGGLKAVERTLGISRQDEVDGLSGGDAVFLWNAYKASGNLKHLHTLIAYNEEDIMNLKPIAEHIVRTEVAQSLP